MKKGKKRLDVYTTHRTRELGKQAFANLCYIHIKISLRKI